MVDIVEIKKLCEGMELVEYQTLDDPKKLLEKKEARSTLVQKMFLEGSKCFIYPGWDLWLVCCQSGPPAAKVS